VRLEEFRGCVVKHTWTTKAQSFGGDDVEMKESVTGVLCKSKVGNYYVDDKSFHCQKRTITILDSTELVFRPHPNKITHICERCAKAQLTDTQKHVLRDTHFLSKAYKCSLCKKTPKYEGIIEKMGNVATLPLWTWEFDFEGLKTKLDGIYNASRGAHLMESSMVYTGMIFAIHKVERAWRNKENYSWTLHSGNSWYSVNAEMPRAPHAEDWDRTFTWDNLKELAFKLQYSGDNTVVAWEHGEADRSYHKNAVPKFRGTQ